jgi:hypothetical protein
MNLRKVSCLLTLALLIFGALASASAQSSAYRISAPYSYKNLTVFLIYGKDELKNKNILTLQEALDRKIFAVYETSDVNELQVENKSKDFEVFIQAGDIVKGGKQDRVLAVDVIIHVRSGRISIEAFCVESGRWEKRGNENSGQFNSSNERIVTKDLKIAANKSRSQSEVWQRVEEAQEKLSKNVGASVNSAASGTSLQLSLENGKVAATAEEYVRKLSSITIGKPDVIGYAFVINGKMNSADVYASNALFQKLWLKLLKATAVEAVADLRGNEKYNPVKPAAVKSFLEDADKGKAEERAITPRMKAVTRENDENLVFESRDDKQNVTIHKSYVKKNN